MFVFLCFLLHIETTYTVVCETSQPPFIKVLRKNDLEISDMEGSVLTSFQVPYGTKALRNIFGPNREKVTG